MQLTNEQLAEVMVHGANAEFHNLGQIVVGYDDYSSYNFVGRLTGFELDNNRPCYVIQTEAAATTLKFGKAIPLPADLAAMILSKKVFDGPND